ncbi:LRRNT 2 domain-containing protein [Citrus sinensis]|nr:LRRNT 2 domain-containing protein [Citrus sinensis]
MAGRNSTFQLVVLLLVLLIKPLFLAAIGIGSNYDCGNFSIRCTEREREALLKFKEGLIDPSARLSSWVGDDCCYWFGVGCSNQTGHVLRLDLGNSLDCSFLDYGANASCLYGDLNWLSGLSSLQYLRLGGIDLSKATTNWLQIVNTLTGLLELRMRDCELQNIPHSLSFINFTLRSSLDLSRNHFQKSPIPEFVYSLKKMKLLDLSESSFSGMLPPNIGNLSNLQYLDLSYQNLKDYQITKELLDLAINGFSGEKEQFIQTLSGCNNSTLETLETQRMNGTISENIGQLAELVALNLYRNSWKGIITENHFQNLTKLNSLYLSSSNKSLVFTMRSDWIPPFSLRQMAINDCQLGSAFPSWLKTQASVFKLTLSNAAISDTIPDWFWGVISQGNLCNLHSLDISYNHITGEIKELTNAFSACNVSTLETLDLASNKLGGNLPDSLGNLLCLEYLGLSENSFLGSLPTSIGNLSHLRALYLSFNVMSRIISENIGQLSEPYMLDLYGNSWEGVITEKHFRNLSGLDYLTISSSNSSLVFNIRHDWIAPFNLYTIRGGTRLLVQGLPKYVTSPNFS